MFVQCPVLGVKQTSRHKAATSAYDPTETLPIDYCALRGLVLYAILYEDRRAPCLACVMTVSYD